MSKRALLARGLSVWPISTLLQKLVPNTTLTALTYHRIGEVDDLDPGLVSCNFAELKWQAGWLREHTRVLHGTEIIPFLDGKLRTDKPATCITFDDGYADNVRAGEVLAALGVPAIFFVVSGFVGSDVVPDWDRLGHAVRHSTSRRIELDFDGRKLAVDTDDEQRAHGETLRFFRAVKVADQPRFLAALEDATHTAVGKRTRPRLFMTWDEARSLGRMGHTVAGHTDTHPIMSMVSAEQQLDELLVSKARLESELSEKVALFAYPVGQRDCYTDETKRLVAQAGFACAFSFYGGSNRVGECDRFDLHRIAVERDVTRPLFQARSTLTPLYEI